MYKIMYPYNKFVWEKNNKTSKHPNKIHILQKYTIKKLTFQNCVQTKKKMVDLLKMKNPQ